MEPDLILKKADHYLERTARGEAARIRRKRTLRFLYHERYLTRKGLSWRLEVLDTALERFLPEADYRQPHGGYYFWVRIPGWNTVRLREIVHAQKIDFRPGVLFSSQDGLGEYMRLSISYHTPEQIQVAIKLLAHCLQEA
jgi:DNA-binding transcriptional MocR family regulator